MSETTRRETESQWAPVFERDGDRFVVLHSKWVGKDHDEAKEIGYGAMLVEGILFGFKNTFDVVEIVDGQLPHFPAKFGHFDVALISGPMFDEYTKPVEAVS